MKAKVLYDFEGAQEGEIDLKEGEIITVTDCDVGDGWCEGMVNGQRGLFPEAYVHLIVTDGEEDEYIGEESIYADANLDETESNISGEGTPSSSQSASAAGSDKSLNRKPSQQVIKTNWNRFSVFVRSGTEDYVLGKRKSAPVPVEQLLSIDERLNWKTSSKNFTVIVSAPTKKQKLLGMKSYISYTVTPSHTNVPVTRRYKHFDWLYNILCSKYPLLSIPPVPQSAAGGKFDVNLVKKRTEKLERWINRVARHPVISCSAVFQHFLTCDEGKKEWKLGKRRAEADPIVGANFYDSVQFESEDFESMEALLGKIEEFGNHIKIMDKKREQLISAGHSFAAAHSVLKREYGKLSEAVNHQLTRDEEYELNHVMEPKIGDWCWRKHCQDCSPMGNALKATWRVYREIGEAYGEQPKNDMLPLIASVKEYNGIIGTYKGILSIHDSSRKKLASLEKMVEEGKIPVEEVEEIRPRTDTITKITLTEINRVHRERQVDHKLMMVEFIKEQIKFHQDVTQKLVHALNAYQSV